MLTLTLQTSDRNNEVAIWDSNGCLAKSDFEGFQQTLGQSSDPQLTDPANSLARPAVPTNPGSSSMLLPMVKSCLDQIDATMADVNRIAVTVGPGMFTPLRVGVVAAKTMAYVHRIPIVGIDVLEAIAIDAAGRHQLAAGHRIDAVVNAQRKQLFVAGFTVTADCRVAVSTPSRLVSAQSWAQTLEGDVLTSGPGLKILSEDTLNTLSQKPKIVVESSDHWRCQSSALINIANHRFENEDTDDPWKLSPIYFRPSAAEEVRSQQTK